MAQPTERKERRGRLKVINGAGWIELSVAPHGKRAAIPRSSILGVMESPKEGVGCFITYMAGQAVTNLAVLDLYLPLIHTLLDDEMVLESEQGINEWDWLSNNVSTQDPQMWIEAPSDSPDVPVAIFNSQVEVDRPPSVDSLEGRWDPDLGRLVGDNPLEFLKPVPVPDTDIEDTVK